MLDPFKIVAGDALKANDDGMLPENRLRSLMGKHCLDLNCRVQQGGPAMVLMFSYADSQPDAVDRIVRKQFEGWHVDRVSVGPIRIFTNDAYHQGWCIVSKAGILTANGDLQAEWDHWSV